MVAEAGADATEGVPTGGIGAVDYVQTMWDRYCEEDEMMRVNDWADGQSCFGVMQPQLGAVGWTHPVREVASPLPVLVPRRVSHMLAPTRRTASSGRIAPGARLVALRGERDVVRRLLPPCRSVV